MTLTYDVAVLVGSLRRGSLSRSIAEALMVRAPASLVMRMVPIGSLPLYDADGDEAPPPAYDDFRAAIRRADAVLFVTPEYNRGVPGCLKNAIDVGSRPPGRSVFDGKPTAVVSQSPGALGGMAANFALRPSLVVLNMPTMPSPEMYLGNSGALFDGAGSLADGPTGMLFDRFLTSFEQWIGRHAALGNAKELAA